MLSCALAGIYGHKLRERQHHFKVLPFCCDIILYIVLSDLTETVQIEFVKSIKKNQPYKLVKFVEVYMFQ